MPCSQVTIIIWGLFTQRLKAVQKAVVEGNWNLAQHLEIVLATSSNFVTQAEMRAAQRTQLDQMRLQQEGKGGGRATSGDSAREEERRRLLAASTPRADTASMPAFIAGREGRCRLSHHTGKKTPLTSPIANPKSSSSASGRPTSHAPSQGQGLSASSNRSARNRVTEPFSGGGGPSRSLLSGARDSFASRQMALCGEVLAVNQLQKTRGAKGTSKSDAMERQGQESAIV